MPSKAAKSCSYRFGSFEFDPQSGELRKQGLRVRLEGQPVAILTLLLERQNGVVTREELQKRLWPGDTFVDFEQSLNAAVRRLRLALDDSAESPRYIETLPRKGYRWIAAVIRSAVPAEVESRSQVTQEEQDRRVEGKQARRLIAAGILLTLTAVAASWWLLPQRTPRVVRSARLSFIGKIAAPFPVFGEWFPAVLTDGSRIYFSSTRDATLKPAYLSVAGGDQVLITTPLDDAELRHISPDGSLLLVYGSLSGQTDKHLWLVPTTEGGARRLEVDGQDGAWSSDGRHLLYAQGHDLFIAEHEGNNSRKLVTTPGKAFWLRWSPDGSRIRFTVVDETSNAQTLWECRSDGSNLHRLAISWGKQPQECCGEWAPDRNHFFFRTFLDARADLWSISELRFPSRVYKPARLTSGPMEFAAAVLSRSGKQLLTVGVEPKWEVISYNLKTQHARAWMPERSAFGPSTSRDGRWIAYVEVRGKEAILWRSKPDGSDRLQLSELPLFVSGVRWSPDGKQIAFMGKMPDKPWNIYVVPTGGGVPRALLNDGRNAVDPEWSQDGNSLMYGRPPESWAEAGASKAIYTLNLASNEIRKLPDSDGLYSPRWSPDGRYVVAMPLDEKKLVLFDFATQQWKDLAAFPRIGNPQWSPDSNYVYIDGFDNVVVRVRRIDGKLEKIVDLKLVDPNAVLCYFEGLTHDEDLLLACPLARGDIYALDLEIP